MTWEDAEQRRVARWEDRERDACGVCFACQDDPSLGPFDNPAYQRMIVCVTCGNKRCPHGTDHRLGCTRSNEPGQAGSRFGGTEGA